MAEEKEHASIVYFIGSDGGPTKIGSTRRINQRLRTIQMHSPLRIGLEAWMFGDGRTEKLIHSKFSDIRRFGEWFSDDDDRDLADFIASRLRQLQRHGDPATIPPKNGFGSCRIKAIGHFNKKYHWIGESAATKYRSAQERRYAEMNRIGAMKSVRELAKHSILGGIDRSFVIEKATEWLKWLEDLGK